MNQSNLRTQKKYPPCDFDDEELFEIIANAEEDIRNGRTISQEEVKARLAKKFGKEMNF